MPKCRTSNIDDLLILPEIDRQSHAHPHPASDGNEQPNDVGGGDDDNDDDDENCDNANKHRPITKQLTHNSIQISSSSSSLSSSLAITPSETTPNLHKTITTTVRQQTATASQQQPHTPTPETPTEKVLLSSAHEQHSSDGVLLLCQRAANADRVVCFGETTTTTTTTTTAASIAATINDIVRTIVVAQPSTRRPSTIRIVDGTTSTTTATQTAIPTTTATITTATTTTKSAYRIPATQFPHQQVQHCCHHAALLHHCCCLFHSNKKKLQHDFLSLSLSPPLNRRREMPALRGLFISL